MSHLWWILSLFHLAYDLFKFLNQFFFSSWKFFQFFLGGRGHGGGVWKFISKVLYSKWSAWWDLARTSIKIFWPNFFRGGRKSPSFFSFSDTLCGVSKLVWRVIWLIAKRISQNRPPQAEKTPKNRVRPPLRGGGRKCPPHIFLTGIPFVGCLNMGQEISEW